MKQLPKKHKSMREVNPKFDTSEVIHKGKWRKMTSKKFVNSEGEVVSEMEMYEPNNSEKLKAVLETARGIMLSCNCGGSKAESSCYSCLRNYYNQKHHDEMKRSYVIDFVNKVLGE